ncbi:MAG: hypothetical protein ACPG8W_02955 [Candidatus Promineifilaceae bacterium]
MNKRVGGLNPQERRDGSNQAAFQQRLPWALAYGFVLLIWLTSRFLRLPQGEISAEFLTLLLIPSAMLLILPWIRVPVVMTLLLIVGGMILGTITLQLSVRGNFPSILSFLQALIIVFLIILPLTWSRITMFMTFLLLTGASLIDSHGNLLLMRGGLLWFLGGMTGLMLTLSYSSKHIAPPFNQDSNKTSFLAFRLMLQNLFRDLDKRRRRARHAPGIAPSFTEIKAGDIATHLAYSVYRGPKYYLALGPGYTMLQGNLSIRETYDMRPHQRIADLKATTRNGIAVETKLFVTFHIRRPETPAEPRLPYPYDRSAVRELKYAETVLQDGSEQSIHPYAQVADRAVEIATEEISRRTLDELFSMVGPDGQETSPLASVSGIVSEKLNIFFSKRGIVMQSVFLLPFVLPKEIVDARLSTWKKKWLDPAKMRFAGRGVRKISEDVAKAELSVVQDLLDNLKQYKQAGSDQLREDLPGYDQIIEQVEQVIKDATTEGLLRSLLPAEKK